VIKVSGFTLIELLVSMALLSMVILVGSSAFGLFSQRWDGQLGVFDRTMRQAKSLMLVQDVLNGLIPYVVYSRDGRPVIYFEGNRNGFVGVSSKSLYSHGDFAVVRFSVKQNENLSFDVLYEEWPMEHDLLVSLSQEMSFSRPLVLFRSVDNPQFEYYGLKSQALRGSDSDLEVVAPPTWTPDYNAIGVGHAPFRTRLIFDTKEGTYQISSVLASELPGLLSRYKFRSSNGSVTSQSSEDRSPKNVVPVDDCDC